MTAIGMDDGLSDRMRGPSLTIWLIGASVVAFVVWAAFAWVDEICGRAGGSRVVVAPADHPEP